MIKGNNWVIFLALVFFACGGQPDVTNEKAYMKWLDDPKNGYVKKEEGEDLTFTVKRIPNELLTHQEAKNTPPQYKVLKDSLLKRFDRDITFLLTIAPKDASKNVMFRDITSLPDFKKRVNDLNFNFGQYLKLQADSLEIAPVLVSFENMYEISGQRSVLIRFLDETDDKHFINASQLTLVWVDEVFWTGGHRFILNQ